MIPVRISPFFWITAALIGYLNSGTLMGTLIWVGIIFVSILVHEFGHALMAKAFGQRPRIELVAFGGLTYPEGPTLSKGKEFLVVLNGPIFGLCLFGLATLALPYVKGDWVSIVRAVQIVNLFWTIVNLLPVMPLDGGQLMRIILEAFFGHKGTKAAICASGIISFMISAFFFVSGALIVGVLFFLFGYQNIDTYRKMRTFSPIDTSDQGKRELDQAIDAFLMKSWDEAERRFETLLKKSGSGMIYLTALEYLAKVKEELGKKDEAYELLLKGEKDLLPISQVLLQQLAYERGNYPLVIRLAKNCYRDLPSLEVALYAAKAHAQLNEIEPAIGWLQAALSEGEVDLSDKAFDAIRSHPSFPA
jgi:stage IV sporulation protein FB